MKYVYQYQATMRGNFGPDACGIITSEFPVISENDFNDFEHSIGRRHFSNLEFTFSLSFLHKINDDGEVVS